MTNSPEYLQLPITPAEGDDIWLACIACGLPTEGRGTVYQDHVGLPVEYIVRIRYHGTTALRGLHTACWDRNKPQILSLPIKNNGFVVFDFDPNMGPTSDVNLKAAAYHGLCYSIDKECYIDRDNNAIRNKFGQKLQRI